MPAILRESGADALCIIPPLHRDKFDIIIEMAAAGNKAGVPNVWLIEPLDLLLE